MPRNRILCPQLPAQDGAPSRPPCREQRDALRARVADISASARRAGVAVEPPSIDGQGNGGDARRGDSRHWVLVGRG